jgi:hypothetical protein
VRGLFLLAYQGIAGAAFNHMAAMPSSSAMLFQPNPHAQPQSLLHIDDATTVTLRDALSDWFVPHLYYRLFVLAKPELPWSFHGLQPARNNVHTSISMCGSDGHAIDGHAIDGHAVNDCLSPAAASPSSVVRVGVMSFFFTRHSVGRLTARFLATMADRATTTRDSDSDSGSDGPRAQLHQRRRLQIVLISKTAATAVDDVATFLHNKFCGNGSSNSGGDNSNNGGGGGCVYLPQDVTGSVDVLRKLSLDVLLLGDVFMDPVVAHIAMFRVAPVQVVD